MESKSRRPGEAVAGARRKAVTMGRECVKHLTPFVWVGNASVIYKVLMQVTLLLQNNLFGCIIMSIHGQAPSWF